MSGTDPQLGANLDNLYYLLRCEDPHVRERSALTPEHELTHVSNARGTDEFSPAERSR
jgi:hypothetical protein